MVGVLVHYLCNINVNKPVDMETMVTIEIGNNSIMNVVSDYLMRSDVKESSRTTYMRNLKAFAMWMQENGKSMETITTSDVIMFKNSLLESGRSVLTVRAYVNAAKQFIAWVANEVGGRNVAAIVKAPRVKKAFKKMHLTGGQVRALECVAATSSKRDLAIVTLMVHTGLRCVEVVRANVSDIQEYQGRTILNVQGKGRDEKDAFVVLSPKVVDTLNDYLVERRAKANEPLFTSASDRNKGSRLSSRMISMIVKDGMKKIGLNGHAYSAHSLRHTTAVAILEKTGSMESAQDVLRHASITTTQIYVESIRRDRRIRQAAELVLDEIF